MKPAILTLLTIAALAVPQAAQKFTGVITDSMCANGDHSRMRMGDTDAQCTVACVEAHGAAYVLFDGKETYELSDQRTPEKFAGKKVTVTGTLNTKTKTIQVESMVETK